MARPRRFSPTAQRPELTPAEPEPPQVPTWRVNEELRCRCPVCGHMPTEREWRRPGPYPIQPYLQRYGGRLKRTEAEEKMGIPPRGYMEYLELSPDQARELVALVRARLREAARTHLGSPG